MKFHNGMEWKKWSENESMMPFSLNELDEWEEEPKFQVRRPSTRPARLQSKRFPFAVAAADAISKVNSSFSH